MHDDDVNGNVSTLRLLNNSHRYRSAWELQKRFLFVYSFMIAGDWFQGPYMYALFESYDMQGHTIAVLFVWGFISSAVLGTFVGSLADIYGRKKLCIAYAIIYILSCITKHFQNFSILFVGRIFGGISTALLFSVFDAWIVHEHSGIPKIKQTFAMQAFLSSCIAILAGVSSQWVLQMAPELKPIPVSWCESLCYWGGYTLPFDLASFFLVIGTILMIWLWPENYGDRSMITKGQSMQQSIIAAQEVINTPNLLHLCFIQGFFGATTFCFVFNWTPALEPLVSHERLGAVYSGLMLSYLIGSQLFIVFSYYFHWTPDRVLLYTCITGAILLLSPIVDHYFGTSTQLVTFFIFEMCIGIYDPCINTIKSRVVDESHRGSIYSVFRIPLNILVIVVLYVEQSVVATLTFCSFLLILSAILQYVRIAKARSRLPRS